jgi:hypothetical protein
MSGQHVEFPKLTPEAKAALARGYEAIGPCICIPTSGESHRCFIAAFLREAMKRAENGYPCDRWRSLEAIADNFHSPPPPPPTLAEARIADLSTPAGRNLVRDFLANLARETQP